MALQFSVTVRNAEMNAIETAISTAPVLEIRTGAAPENCAAADTGTLIASMTLPENWMADADAGKIVLAGTWQDASANASGTAGHFRIKQSSTCHIQGTVGESGSGADMIIDNADINAGQAVEVRSFEILAGNA